MANNSSDPYEGRKAFDIKDEYVQYDLGDQLICASGEEKTEIVNSLNPPYLFTNEECVVVDMYVNVNTNQEMITVKKSDGQTINLNRSYANGSSRDILVVVKNKVPSEELFFKKLAGWR